MKNLNIILISILLTIISFPGCHPDKKIDTHTPVNNKNGKTSLINMLTPGGERLLPAEQGPVRTALEEPAIDLNTYKLEITGLVDLSYSLTWEEIQQLPVANSDTILMYCVEGWEVWGDWEGILINDLLDKAHVQPEGKYILFSSVEGYKTSFPISYLKKYKAILAYNVNGSPLKESDGFPLRLIAFGKYGYKWEKWVNKLEVVNQSQIGYWEGYGYPDRADVPIIRRSYYEGVKAEPLVY